MSVDSVSSLDHAMASTSASEPSHQIVAAVAERFDVTGTWTRVLAGERSIAFRLDTEVEPWFVKIEHRLSDEQVDETATLVELAAQHDVPTARPRAGEDGRYAQHVDELTISVSSWVSGTTLRTPVSRTQAEQLGTALGRIHGAFSQLTPPPILVTASDEPWMVWNRHAVEAGFQHVENLVRERGTDPDGFDRIALQTLAERRTWVDAIGDALTGLPPLTRLVGHGDFAAPNLLFDGDRLTAVVDFSARATELLAFELGRIAYGPEITLSPGGEALTRAVLDAYARANPLAREVDIAHAGVCAFIQLARSVYPLDERYGGTGKFPDDLDDFWVRRHRTANRLLADMPVINRR